MLKEERHSYILDSIQKNQKVLTLELSDALSVSEDTIRRDLKELSDRGQLKKVHGGAISLSLNPFDYRDREVYALEQKKLLANKAARLIKENTVIIIDGGTTNLELVKALPKSLSATVFTNSIPIASELAQHPRTEVIFAGGRVLKQAQVTVGEEAINTFRGLYADQCFLGVRSIHHQIGITEIDWEETLVKRSMIHAAAEIVSLLIPEKIETVNPYKIGETQRLNKIISCLPQGDQRLDLYEGMGIETL
ncbi:DeoR/GlpR family DNA-binding transcription regulator [Moorena bouillonii]|uniref:Lactose phosphotransferase system repressor n=1 Tax=Moorena bouillonii PNG TaxID=568701 RepID=A0A1U7N1D3_9CYAN|nr:DeoR/GlpR family DNA-binding transcription regulator [Moorena bouillonii]OLT59768.1 DeoR family transcriptional regulator [Moorena bouillonii PNG]